MKASMAQKLTDLVSGGRSLRLYTKLGLITIQSNVHQIMMFIGAFVLSQHYDFSRYSVGNLVIYSVFYFGHLKLFHVYENSRA